MITANYFLDIISGAIKDITIGLETEEFLFEVFSTPDIVTNDDIRYLKQYKIDILYSGISFKYENETFNYPRFNLTDEKFYLWSKSPKCLKNNKFNCTYLMSSEVEGIDVFKLSKYCIKLSKIIEKSGHKSLLENFNEIRNISKLEKQVIAPIGNNTYLFKNK